MEDARARLQEAPFSHDSEGSSSLLTRRGALRSDAGIWTQGVELWKSDPPNRGSILYEQTYRNVGACFPYNSRHDNTLLYVVTISALVWGCIRPTRMTSWCLP